MVEEPIGNPTVEAGAVESQQPGSDRSNLYTGQCVGGPLNGRVEQSRYPKGFVLVDKAARLVWIYDYEPNDPSQTPGVFSTFRCRDLEGRSMEDQKRLDAAMGHEYDVRAV